jgi:hypothetical protein
LLATGDRGDCGLRVMAIGFGIWFTRPGVFSSIVGLAKMADDVIDIPPTWCWSVAG